MGNPLILLRIVLACVMNLGKCGSAVPRSVAMNRAVRSSRWLVYGLGDRRLFCCLIYLLLCNNFLCCGADEEWGIVFQRSQFAAVCPGSSHLSVFPERISIFDYD